MTTTSSPSHQIGRARVASTPSDCRTAAMSMRRGRVALLGAVSTLVALAPLAGCRSAPAGGGAGRPTSPGAGTTAGALTPNATVVHPVDGDTVDVDVRGH